MTEDDTFDRLRRLPFTAMERLLMNPYSIESKWNIIQKSGWTEDEFRDEYTRRYLNTIITWYPPAGLDRGLLSPK